MASYNSVGAGEKPTLGYCSSVDNKSRPGGAQSAERVKVMTDIPKVARPGGAQGGGLKPAGEAPKAARPGGAQGV
jgi:hypothetical protein